jgi:hypothetical protein
LVQALNFIGKALNDNEYCLGVFFDLRKAFDVCSYDVLIMKLEKMGIKGNTLSWFKSYLTERKQFVDIDGHASQKKYIKTCIIQGSILGPTLFNIYINDLHFVSESLTLMFADDTFALRSEANLTRLIELINLDINKMAIWFKANKLAVNKTKTKYMIFRTRGKRVDTNIPKVLYDENEPNLPFNTSNITTLERYHNNHENQDCRAYKLLGIYLDEFLSFDAHVKHISNKLTRSLYCIRMAKNNLNYHGLRSLYFALIHSHLSYCPTILNCLSASHKSKLFKLQKKAIRIMTGSTYNAHTLPLFLDHKVLPFDKILKQGKLLFMHSIRYNYAPKSFSRTWTRNNNRPGNYNLRNDEQFAIPVPRIELFKRLPYHALPTEWNNSGNLQFYENKITFKHALREQLFTELLEPNDN